MYCSLRHDANVYNRIVTRVHTHATYIDVERSASSSTRATRPNSETLSLGHSPPGGRRKQLHTRSANLWQTNPNDLSEVEEAEKDAREALQEAKDEARDGDVLAILLQVRNRIHFVLSS